MLKEVNMRAYHRHITYLDASLAARPYVNGAAILVRATLHKSHSGTEENIPDSAAVWGSTDRRTLIKQISGDYFSQPIVKRITQASNKSEESLFCAFPKDYNVTSTA